ncbi:MAG: hypothetical protein RL114_889 [Actinomycetota bacterium]|jgi:uncharacterized protein YqjF (DUF2071 family)
MTQRWTNLAYVHWRYEPSVIQALLPEGLEVDTHDGSAWVGLIPFSMRDVGVPKLPPVPYFGNFPEVNVRTYVKRNGIPGVWFFSLDVNRLAPALVARTTYLLPYCWGKASNELADDVLKTSVRRRWPDVASTKIEVRVGDAVTEQDELQKFLTARWGLYSKGIGNSLMYAPVDHEPWPLHRAQLVSLADTLVIAAGIPTPQGEPHVMFSPGVSVRIGLPHRVKL